MLNIINIRLMIYFPQPYCFYRIFPFPGVLQESDILLANIERDEHYWQILLADIIDERYWFCSILTFYFINIYFVVNFR